MTRPDRHTSSPPAPVVILSDRFAGRITVPGVEILRFANFREELIAVSEDGQALAWAGGPVIGALLDSGDAADMRSGGPLARLADAMGLRIEEPGSGADTAALGALIAQFLVARLADLSGDAQAVMQANAEIRDQHLQLQADHAELEAWIHDALAPDFRRVRDWPATHATIALGPGDGVDQPLPTSLRGVIALDVHVAESCAAPTTLRLSLRLPGGEEACPPVEQHLPEGFFGWTRLGLTLPAGGPPRDGIATLTASGPCALSLGPQTPFEDLWAQGKEGPCAAPLALRIYQTTQRMGLPPLHDPRDPLPADGITRLVLPCDLPAPEILEFAAGKLPRALRGYPDAVAAGFDAARNAIAIRPSAKRPVVCRIAGLEANGLSRISGLVQLGRHDCLDVSFAIGAAPAGAVRTARAAIGHLGDWHAVLPGAWGEVWHGFSPALVGPVDLFLAVAMPNAPFNTNADALFRGIRLTARS